MKKRNNVPDVNPAKNITRYLQHIISYHHQFNNAFNILITSSVYTLPLHTSAYLALAGTASATCWPIEVNF